MASFRKSAHTEAQTPPGNKRKNTRFHNRGLGGAAPQVQSPSAARSQQHRTSRGAGRRVRRGQPARRQWRDADDHRFGAGGGSVRWSPAGNTNLFFYIFERERVRTEPAHERSGSILRTTHAFSFLSLALLRSSRTTGVIGEDAAIARPSTQSDGCKSRPPAPRLRRSRSFWSRAAFQRMSSMQARASSTLSCPRTPSCCTSRLR